MEDYDFFVHRISFSSVVPKIGVGYLGGNNTSTTLYCCRCKLRLLLVLLLVYYPKYTVRSIQYNYILLSLENEFSFLNGFAYIKDQYSIHVRRNSNFFNCIIL